MLASFSFQLFWNLLQIVLLCLLYNTDQQIFHSPEDNLLCVLVQPTDWNIGQGEQFQKFSCQ